MVRETPVTFPSGSLTLEGVLYVPDEGEHRSLAVVCHPHPQYGGDMANLVVTVIVRGLIEAGCGALAFNFRGVGASEGAYDNGVGERDDARAALDYARGLPGVDRVGLAGYSFGAGMAAAAVDASVPALALVAMPSGMGSREGSGLTSYSGPVLLVVGSADNIAQGDAIAKLAAALPSSPEVHIVPGADHFWWGHERALCDLVRDFFHRTLATPALT